MEQWHTQVMRVTVVTPCLNAVRFIEAMLQSVAVQRRDGLEVEHLILDGGSTDGTLELLAQQPPALGAVTVATDKGPADAINQGLARATGSVLAWLNADDLYAENAVARACEALARHPGAAFCFGHCPMIDANGHEIQRGITRFKEFWYPLASRPVLQTLNFISQPAVFFRHEAWRRAGPLRTDLKAAWDYEFWLRLWRQGGAVRVKRPPLACFRWTPHSISGREYRRQFAEEQAAAAADAGRWAPQSLLHALLCKGIVLLYERRARHLSSAQAPAPTEDVHATGN